MLCRLPDQIKRLFGLLFVFATLARSGSAFATTQDPPTIVLVASNPEANMMASLRGELRALGLQVLVVQRPEREVSPHELTEVARANRAIGAFRVLVDEGRVEVWLADRVTGKVLLREVVTTKEGSQSQTDESTVVARAVELLRASLLELDIGESRGGQPRPAPMTLPQTLRPAKKVEPPAARIKHWGVGTGLGYFGGIFSRPSGNLDSLGSPGLAVALRFQPTTNWGSNLRVMMPVANSEYRGAQGRAQLTPRWVSWAARWTSREFGPRFHGSIESGVGLLFINIVGIGNAGYSGRSSFSVDPFFFAGGELSYSLSHSVALSFTDLFGYGVRPTEVVFDTDVIGRYGRLIGAASLGVDFSWD